jgi:hypothetical protein
LRHLLALVARTVGWRDVMDVKLFIDVREGSLSIAEVSTTAGIRAPLVVIAASEPSAEGITLELDANGLGLALHLTSAWRSSSCSRSSW